MKILVVDIETTGFHKYGEAIVEIALALVDTNTKTTELLFSEVVKDKNFKFEKHKDAWIFQQTDLTPEEVENATPLEDFRDKIQGYFDKYKVTAFNKAFDLRFLRARKFICDDVKCLMKASAEHTSAVNKNGNRKMPSVEDAYNEFFIKEGEEPYTEKHRAMFDVLDESRILLHLTSLKGKKIMKESGTDVIKKKKVRGFPTYKPVTPGSPMPFGKYKGTEFKTLVKDNLAYVNWAIKEVSGFRLSKHAKLLLDKANNKK